MVNTALKVNYPNDPLSNTCHLFSGYTEANSLVKLDVTVWHSRMLFSIYIQKRNYSLNTLLTGNIVPGLFSWIFGV